MLQIKNTLGGGGSLKINNAIERKAVHGNIDNVKFPAFCGYDFTVENSPSTDFTDINADSSLYGNIIMLRKNVGVKGSGVYLTTFVIDSSTKNLTVKTLNLSISSGNSKYLCIFRIDDYHVFLAGNSGSAIYHVADDGSMTQLHILTHPRTNHNHGYFNAVKMRDNIYILHEYYSWRVLTINSDYTFTLSDSELLSYPYGGSFVKVDDNTVLLCGRETQSSTTDYASLYSFDGVSLTNIYTIALGVAKKGNVSNRYGVITLGEIEGNKHYLYCDAMALVSKFYIDENAINGVIKVSSTSYPTTYADTIDGVSTYNNETLIYGDGYVFIDSSHKAVYTKDKLAIVSHDVFNVGTKNIYESSTVVIKYMDLCIYPSIKYYPDSSAYYFAFLALIDSPIYIQTYANIKTGAGGTGKLFNYYIEDGKLHLYYRDLNYYYGYCHISISLDVLYSGKNRFLVFSEKDGNLNICI